MLSVTLTIVPLKDLPICFLAHSHYIIFIAFLVVNHNFKKKKQKEEEKKSRPHGFYGDDTV